MNVEITSRSLLIYVSRSLVTVLSIGGQSTSLMYSGRMGTRWVCLMLLRMIL